MLERLFNLGEYGDKLSSKLSKEINKEKTENSVLLGQLMGYEDISEDKKKEKEEELNISIENLEKANKELKEIEKSFKENYWHYDIVSSVPRVVYYLTNKEWLDESIDIYKLIAEELDWEFNQETRKVIKEKVLKANFYLKIQDDNETKAIEIIKKEVALDNFFDD